MVEVQHIYCVCQPGAEAPLKAEVAARAPELRFGFSRPGFVTFKLPEATPVEQLELPPFVFARARGASLGKAVGSARAAELAQQLWSLPKVQKLIDGAAIAGLHVWQRETKLPGVNGVEPGASELAQEITQVILNAAPDSARNRLSPDCKVGDRDAETTADPDLAVGAEACFEDDAAASLPEPSVEGSSRASFVLDVALVEPNEWWIGCHTLRTRVDRWPGGVLAIELPEHAVSRAYLKMAEALRWAAPPAARGELWVELGCAPGGASQALLDSGMYVLGVDPAEVDPAVLADERFAHLRGRASDIKRRELNDARWLAADINAAPEYTLDAVEGVVTHADAHFRGLLLTLKLPYWNVATPEHLDAYAERIRGWGFRDVRMRQLAFNRKEICVVALRSRSQRRLRR